MNNINVALIPARGGSKGIKRKNLIDLNGYPLIYWTIAAAKKSKIFDEVFVNTEDVEIKKICLNYGVKIFDRSEDLATDMAKSEDVIADFLSKTNTDKIRNICLLQPTSPLRDYSHIKESYDVFMLNDADMVISVFEPSYHPAKAYQINSDGTISGLVSDNSPYMPRQQLSDCYYPNGAIYWFRESIFRINNQFPKKNIYPYVMPNKISIDIDDVNDLNQAKELLKERV